MTETPTKLGSNEPALPPRARWTRRAVALGSGVLAGLAFPGFGFELLGFVCFAGPLFLLIAGGKGASPRDGFRVGWLFGIGFYAVALHWMFACLSAFSGLPSPAVVLVFAVFTAYHGCVYGVGFAGFAVGRRAGVPVAIAAPIALAGGELLFPAIGPIHVGTALGRWDLLRQATEVIGMSGLTAVCALVGAAIAVLVHAALVHAVVRGVSHGDSGSESDGTPANAIRRCRAALPAALAAFVVLAALSGFGRYRIGQVDRAVQRATRHLRVGICQANIGGVTKEEHVIEALATYRRLAGEAAGKGAELIVFPENAWPEVIAAHTARLNPGYFGAKLPMVVGALDVTPNQRYRNVAVLFDAEGNILDRYAKQRLVPLGEHVPFADRFPWLLKALPHADHFEPGRSDEPLRLRSRRALVGAGKLDDLRLTTFICYEAIYPRLIRRLLNASPEGPPDLLVNLTNDSWYGTTTEQRLHLAYTAFRAVEARRSLVRATNTGISALLDPAGRVTARTGEHVEAALVGEVAVVALPSLFYRFGGVFPGALMIGFVGLLALGWLRGRRSVGVPQGAS